ncbi:Origin recognition complex subunit 6 [Wickerhamomyces ciferrii]|uniref:Origin recognition complex subunit 6 n=1 Tax=Wickerhamomyces ciferrii (strain ATCC 14091 / BCRC 22168 / CBS 111 / JCM 3599 / NBRC 0793 / NRRL Y-1031 F-60-10) TaxID=1206466 RepID=K0K808_WICCF|nr:Origin recognition complex subunit 6 [Wickerhamomyces ciferrii]CCH40950.1 Origin recognition complex subunit 6 [Wickerhamomyces ciferrii]
MSSPFVIAAIRDVAPTLSEPYPQELRRLIDSLYDYSKFKISLSQNEEIARYHICAILAIERLKPQFNFQDPVLDKAPVPTKMVAQLLNIFQNHFQVKSSKPTPVSTPKKKIDDKKLKVPTPSPSPSKRKPGRPPGSPNKLTLRQKLEKASGDKSTSSSNSTPQNSPKKQIISDEFLQKTPKKNTQSQPNTPTKSILKFNGNKTGPTSNYSSPTKYMKLLSASEITALCNKFQLDTDVTQNIIETFKQYCRKVSNEWILLCGLIINCYFVIHHKVINEQLGSKTSTIKAMFSLQNGGLMLEQVNTSVNIAHNLIAYNKWFKQLKIKHGVSLESQSIASTTGNMISPEVQFHSAQKQKAYHDWLQKIKTELIQKSLDSSSNTSANTFL